MSDTWAFAFSGCCFLVRRLFAKRSKPEWASGPVRGNNEHVWFSQRLHGVGKYSAGLRGGSKSRSRTRKPHLDLDIVRRTVGTVFGGVEEAATARHAVLSHRQLEEHRCTTGPVEFAFAVVKLAWNDMDEAPEQPRRQLAFDAQAAHIDLFICGLEPFVNFNCRPYMRGEFLRAISGTEIANGADLSHAATRCRSSHGKLARRRETPRRRYMEGSHDRRAKAEDAAQSRDYEAHLTCRGTLVHRFEFGPRGRPGGRSVGLLREPSGTVVAGTRSRESVAVDY